MKALLRLISDGLTGSRSASLAGFLAISWVLLIRNLQFLAPEWTGDIRFFLLAAVGAVLIAGTVLWASTRLLIPNRNVRPSNPWVVLFCYLLAGVANWLMLQIALPNAAGPAHVGWLGGLIQSVLFVAFWLIVASSISTAIAQHETTARLLQLENQDLQATRDHVQAQLTRFAAELSQRVLHELIPMLERLRIRAGQLQVTSKPSTVLEFAEQLRTVAHDSIRPVAHRLDAELIDPGTPTRSPSAPVVARPQHRLAAITRLALTGDPIRPVGAALVGALVAILTIAAPRLAIPYLLVAVPTNLAVLYGFRAVIPAQIWNRSLPRSAVLLSLAYAVAGACSIFSIPIVGLTPFAAASTNPDLKWQLWSIPMALSGFICGWSWSLGRGLAIRLAQENRDLLAAVVTQQWEVSQLEGSLADVRRRISHLVHTDVQGTVAGCGVLLQRAAEQADEDVAMALDRTMHRLEQTLTGLQDSLNQDHSATTRVGEGLAAVADAWRGIVDVTVAVDPSAEECLNSSGALSRATVDIVSEAVSNATIHGAARNVEISVALLGDQLSIEVSDDGTGPPTTITTGSGLSKIKAMGSAWTLERNEPSGATFRATLPGASVNFG
jgi:signal transduction histidine kinase